MPWTSGPQMGFTEGEPWLPLAVEHAGMSVEEQEADEDSPLAFSRQIIALRNATPALKLGEIAFVQTEAPLIAFTRTHEGDEVICVFNLSPEPQVFAHPSLARADLLPIRAGDADLRGESLGLSPFAAVFLRLV